MAALLVGVAGSSVSLAQEGFAPEPGAPAAAARAAGQPRTNPGRILVKFRHEVARGADADAMARAALASLKVEDKSDIVSVPGLSVLKISGDTGAAINALRSNPDVEYAELDYAVSVSGLSNDPLISQSWALQNTGQSVNSIAGLPGADIRAADAWPIAAPKAQIAVAVIDTGVAMNHPDLAGSIWTNPHEIPGNGIDDDGNGYIDDIHGWNFIKNTPNAQDDNGHGTHCAGIIAAARNNFAGSAGVSSSARIVALKFLDAGGSGWTSDAVRAIDYCVRTGIRISNNSWGSLGLVYPGVLGDGLKPLMDVIRRARDAGHLFVAAAGNESLNNDSELASFPASLPLDNIVSVAATDNRDRLAWFSSYGVTTADLAAPGVDIMSTFWSAANPSGYRLLSGTSMATPHVTGVASMLLAKYPAMSYSELRNRLLDTARPVAGFRGLMVAPGVLNAYDAVRLCPPDQNGDGTIDEADFSEFFVAYNELVVPWADPKSDLNMDGLVDDADFQILTGAYDVGGCTLPPAPASLAVANVSPKSIRLTWRNASSDTRAIRVERSSDGVHFAPAAVLPPSATEVTIPNSKFDAPGAQYWFRIAASNLGGSSKPGPAVTATTITLPAAPTNLRASAVWARAIDLAWNDNATNETGYHVVFWGPDNQPRDGGSFGPNTRSCRVGGLEPKTGYRFAVYAMNQAGESAASEWSDTTKSSVSKITVYATSVPDQPNWNNPSRATGAPNSNGQDSQYANTTSNTAQNFLTATNFGAIKLPANSVVTHVWFDVNARYNTSTTGDRIRARLTGGVAQKDYLSPAWNQNSSDDAMRWRMAPGTSGLEITGLRAWNESALNAMQIGVRRESGGTTLRIDGYRLTVQVEEDLNSDGIPDGPAK